MNAPSSLYTHIPSLCNSTTDAQMVFSPPLIKIPPNTLSALFFGLQVTEKQPVLFGPTGGRVSTCVPAGQPTTQSPSVFCQGSNLAVRMVLGASKLHAGINWLPGQEMCVFSVPSREIYEVSEVTNHSKCIPSESKKPWGKRHSPESHFHLVACSRILYNAPFNVSPSKAIRSTILYVYIVAVRYRVCEQSYLCCVYFTITFHRYFHNIKKVFIVFILTLCVL